MVDPTSVFDLADRSGIVYKLDVQRIGYETHPRTLSEWFSAIAHRRLVLPEFQRFEAWEPSKVTALLQSIVDGLPVGSLLILRSTYRELPFKWRPIEGAPKEGEEPVELLLDGQQRLTAIWKALTDGYENYRYGVRIWSNKEKDENEDTLPQVERLPKRQWMDDPAEWAKRGIIPLRLMDPTLGARELRQWRKKAAQGDPDLDGRLEDHIIEIRARFSEFVIPYIALKTDDPEAVLSVFINTNTKVTLLSPFDLVVAYFARPGVSVDLHQLVRDLREAVPALRDFSQIDDLDLLRAEALLQGLRPTNREILKLDGHRLQKDWERLIGGAHRAFSFLQSEGILTGAQLPTEAVIPVLIALWSNVPEGGFAEGNARITLRRYIWAAFFSDRYDRATATRAQEDYKALQRRLQGEDVSVPAFEASLPTNPEFLINAGWPARKDRLARAILGVIMRGRCLDPHDGAPLGLENLKGREYHHLFPKAYLTSIGKDEKEGDRALNVALITWRTNRSISAKEPERYLREAAKALELGEEEMRRRLLTHLIPVEEFKRGDYEAFLKTRARMVWEGAQALLRGEDWHPSERCP